MRGYVSTVRMDDDGMIGSLFWFGVNQSMSVKSMKQDENGSVMYCSRIRVIYPCVIQGRRKKTIHLSG